MTLYKSLLSAVPVGRSGRTAITHIEPGAEPVPKAGSWEANELGFGGWREMVRFPGECEADILILKAGWRTLTLER